MPRGLSQRAHTKVVESALELFAERGVDATSVDAIAAASGVSKATIYKHWADKDALAMEVMVYVHESDDGPPDRDSGDLKADVIAYLLYEPPRHKAELKNRIMPHLIAYSARNPEFGRAWRTRVLERARSGLKKLLRQGIERGIFSAVLDEELAVALLLGPMMFSHIFGQRLDRTWLANGTVESFWKACARQRSEAVRGEGRSVKQAGKKSCP
jgi:AcrR family transcriptional regulator